ncbi:MAG: hypothetical protein ABII25_09970 [bacterium]
MGLALFVIPNEEELIWERFLALLEMTKGVVIPSGSEESICGRKISPFGRNDVIGQLSVELVGASFSLRCYFAVFRRLKPAATTKD